jgi:hypothetical protein
MFAAQTIQIKQYDGVDKKPKAAQKSTAESQANSGNSMFFSRDTEKPVKPTTSVAKGSQIGERRPHSAVDNIVEENCTPKATKRNKTFQVLKQNYQTLLRIIV